MGLSQCCGFEILGERERQGGGEKFLQGQQIPPRTSKLLGYIPKQNKISLIFQQAGGEASLPTFPGAGQPHSPFPHLPREKDLGREQGQRVECQKDWQQEREFLLHSSNLIHTRVAGLAFGSTRIRQQESSPGSSCSRGRRGLVFNGSHISTCYLILHV